MFTEQSWESTQIMSDSEGNLRVGVGVSEGECEWGCAHVCVLCLNLWSIIDTQHYIRYWNAVLIWHLHTMQSDHPSKSISHLFLAIFKLKYYLITCGSQAIYVLVTYWFYNYKVVLFDPLTHFIHLVPTSLPFGNH